ncbi:low molecular weight phosphatase family protein [Listeria newyorkensis]|uniref:Low molecular weight phosphatase family protein n=1 Tax=Listeria newyorkensis TaxID=1497681 RepID=A0ABX4XPB6_9LIST|nr:MULTISPECIES: arsenate reductase ArsC [Listeria]KGL44471.1 ArsC family transcriptional regulator [Listeriaceae bacterium FSL A5-0209]KGL45670.1 ArsC family transcriptional regulator [Listeria newyorkensis]KMT62804.1 protein-tyrosine-phosphatase [Listeria newyorkensis]PNP88259.1 low molecular weight phosphatase family protein [Listeria newyorkensis]RQW65423.1 arsenate reductase ArsC [Listeria sp. SHR_NRA_18]
MTKIAFICIHNSCRSQMAEAWGKVVLGDISEVYSAGTEEYPEVKPLAVVAMNEVGIDTSEQHPKLLKDIPQKLDILITMGCGVECPYVPAKYREDWGLDDPSGGTIEDFRVTRDLIETRVNTLRDRILNGDIKDKLMD